MSNAAKIEQYSGVNPMTYNSGSFSSGVGYVVLSREIDRKTYIENCYRNNIITIVSDKSELIRNCLILKSAWKDIQFPSSFKERGSCVIWINIPILNKCVIVGVVNKKDDYNNFNDNQSNDERKTEQASAAILKDGDNGSVKIMSDSLGEDGGVFVNVTNADELGMFKVYVQGGVDIQAENAVQIKAKSVVQIWVGDESEENRGNLIEISSDHGFKFEDEHNNTISINDEGIDIIDKYNNKIVTDENGILIEREDCQIALESGKGFKTVVSNGDTIELIDKDLEDNKESAVTYTPLKDKLEEIIDSMSDICQAMATATVVSPLGGSALPMFPTTISQFTQLKINIETLKTSIKGMESKTLKIT